MIGAILARLGADGSEVEGTTVGFAAPTVYVIALWTVFNLILLAKPFDWITARQRRRRRRSRAASPASSCSRTPAAGAVRRTDRDRRAARPDLRRDRPQQPAVALARRPARLRPIISPALAVVLGLTDSPMQMRNALPILLLLGDRRGSGWPGLATGPAARSSARPDRRCCWSSIPWTFQAMKTYRYQNLESHPSRPRCRPASPRRAPRRSAAPPRHRRRAGDGRLHQRQHHRPRTRSSPTTRRPTP